MAGQMSVLTLNVSNVARTTPPHAIVLVFASNNVQRRIALPGPVNNGA